MPKRIGIFGGSFNPVHHGHLLVARAAAEALRLDELRFVPCFRSAHGKKLMPAGLRLKMLKAVLRGVPGFVVDDCEIRRGGISRSVDTLRELRRRLGPQARFFFLIGQDQVLEFPKWKEADGIGQLARISVLTRPGYRKNTLIHKKYRFLTVDVPQYEISSSEIRSRLKKKLSIDWLLPEAALSFL
jgi:nicotinate-nucleotide adenylyltransferase